MRGWRTGGAVVVLALVAACGETSAAGPDPSPSATPSASATPSTSATPPPSASPPERASYDWLSDIEPSDTYSVAFVRGLTAPEALRALGTVAEEVGPVTLDAALDLESDRTDPETYEAPPVVQVDEHDGGVLIFSPYGFRPYDRLRALSRGGVAAGFTTTVELDTSVTVARSGRVVREFDPLYYDRRERRSALPEEKGAGLTMDINANGFAASWRVLDRVTDVHVDEAWFRETPHPTYVLADED